MGDPRTRKDLLKFVWTLRRDRRTQEVSFGTTLWILTCKGEKTAHVPSQSPKLSTEKNNAIIPKIENYVLFGRHTEDLSPKTDFRETEVTALKRYREEPGYIGVFAKKKKNQPQQQR